MGAEQIVDAVLDGMAAAMEAKFNARHPVLKLPLSVRLRVRQLKKVGPRRNRGPFKRAKEPGSPTFASGFAKLNRSSAAWASGKLREGA